MKKHYVDLPEWEFYMEEVSAGVYEVRARDKAGHQVSAKGSELASLLEKCLAEARELSKKTL